MSALAAFFESYYRLRPVNATFTGVHDHDHRLPDWSPDGLAAAADEMRRVRGALVATRKDGPARPPRADTSVGPYGDVSAMALDDVAVRDRELAISFRRSRSAKPPSASSR